MTPIFFDPHVCEPPSTADLIGRGGQAAPQLILGTVHPTAGWDRNPWDEFYVTLHRRHM